MRLRYVLLLTSAMGAAAALLLAADLYRRVREAERMAAGKDAATVQVLTGSLDVIGIAVLAVLFLALFLMLVVASRDPVFVATVENTPLPHPTQAPLPAQAESAIQVGDGFQSPPEAAAAVTVPVIPSALEAAPASAESVTPENIPHAPSAVVEAAPVEIPAPPAPPANDTPAPPSDRTQ